MAMFREDEDIANCATQSGYMPTFGYPPTSSDASAHEDIPAIRVGLKELIPRWNIHINSPCVLKYYVQAETFQNPAELELTRNLLQVSAKLWNDVGCGVTFDTATDLHQAHFTVEYSTVNKPDVAAMSFFPDRVSKFYIFSDAFHDPKTRAQLVNTFTHEFGHILGLRHEAPGSKEPATLLLGEANEDSIMGYNRATRKLQPSDQDGLRKFYQLTVGTQLGTIPITDYPPQTLG